MKWPQWLLVGIGAVFVVGFMWVTSYNGLVAKDEAVKQSYSQVQNVMQRRADLIPNLVSTVQGYAIHEKDVFEDVAKARAQVGAAVQLDPEKLANNPDLQKQLFAAQAAMQSSLSRLLAVAEAYPDLKANQGFLNLQAELAGTENRIAVERRNNILAVQTYNRSIRSFPTSIVASVGGFGPKEYFEADEKSQQVPVVKF